MHLKLEELQKVVKKTIKEEQRHSALREELFRVFGPPVMISKNHEKVAEAVNEQLDLSESSGQHVHSGLVKTSVLIEASVDSSATVRKMAARLLPQKMIVRLLNDPSSSVRCAAAKRCSYSVVKETVKKFPNDDQLKTIARIKKLQEAGLPDPKPVEEPFDMYGEEPLGDAATTKYSDKDFSDEWYARLAHKLCNEYGKNLEGNWEETIATRVAASQFSTSGTRIDRDKLLKCIYDCIEERENAILGEGSLKAIARRLLRESYMDDAVMPLIEDRNDAIADLLESNCSSMKYVEEAERLFSIKKTSVPAGIKKYRLGEGSHKETLIPVNAKIPGGKMTVTVEGALDRYVDSWNKRQALEGEPYRLSWGPGAAIDSVSFNLTLK